MRISLAGFSDDREALLIALVEGSASGCNYNLCFVKQQATDLFAIFSFDFLRYRPSVRPFFLAAKFI